MAEDESRAADGRRRWQQWREEEAQSVLAEHARSGQSLTRFARERGVSLRRLMYWRKRLSDGGSPAFVAVTLPPPAASPSGGRVEIEADGVAVRVREDLDVEQLARIVAAVRRSRSGC